MADMKPQIYKDDRPAEYFDQFHAAARRGVGWTYAFVRVARLAADPAALARPAAIGVENVPKTGPLILAPNHFSQMDHFFIGLYLRRKIRFMAKSQIFGPPVLTYIFTHGGVFPVRRGHHDEEAFKTAFTLLEQEEMLLVYAEGGRSRSGELGEPKAGDRADRARIRRAGRPGRDPRLGRGAALEALPLPEGDASSTASRCSFAVEQDPEPRAPARGRDARSSTGCGRCTRGSSARQASRQVNGA